jgi:hypothetical protein
MCNVYKNIISTGFEAADGWDLGESICGLPFGYGVTCFMLKCKAGGVINFGGFPTGTPCYLNSQCESDDCTDPKPVSNVCLTKNHPASQNCCPDDPNEINGWSMSPSSRHCRYPKITDVNPSPLKGASTQHLRFEYDVLGGGDGTAANLPGCSGFGSACRQRYITSQGNLTQVSHSVWKEDIAWSGTLGSSMVEFHGADTHAGSIQLTSYLYWYFGGTVYLYDQIEDTFVVGGYWSDTVPDYAQMVVDLNPCENTVTYTYAQKDVNGVLQPAVVIHTEVYGFTPPYGDQAGAGGVDARPATTDTTFGTTDHYAGVTIDIDNYVVTNTPCTEACCDQDTGDCDDVPPGQCGFKTVYPNTKCAQLGGSICFGGTKPFSPCQSDGECPGSVLPPVLAGICSQVYPPVCALPLGSCCDTSPLLDQNSTGVCTTGVLEADCSGAQKEWLKGGSCTKVVGQCHTGHGSCSPATGCSNFPVQAKKCAVDLDCNAPGFCYAGTCSPAPLPGHCVYPNKGYCAGMGSCVGQPACNPDNGTNCCDNGCTPPILCASGIPGDCVGKADCDAVPGGADCAFCEPCNALPVTNCHIPFDPADCPPPFPGLPAGTGCEPNPPVGCNGPGDCAEDSRPCLIPVVNKAGTLCTTDAECGITASSCLEHTGACCDGTPKATHCTESTPTAPIYAEDCVGLNQTWIKLGSCSAVPDICPALTLGACCNIRDALCTDNTVKNDPQASNNCGDTGALDDQRVFTLDGTCLNVTCDAEIGACCDHDTFGVCTNLTFAECNALAGGKGEWTKRTTCAAIECTHLGIPTVSEWGLVVLTLLLLVGAKVYFGRRQNAAA